MTQKKTTRKKNVKSAMDKETRLREEIKARMECPTKGKGIDKQTYATRAKLLSDAKKKKEYIKSLEEYLPEYFDMVDSLEDVVERIQNTVHFGSLERGQLFQHTTWRHLGEIVTFMSVRHMVSIDALLNLYAMFEKEVDDYLRSYYGISSISVLHTDYSTTPPVVHDIAEVLRSEGVTDPNQEDVVSAIRQLASKIGDVDQLRKDFLLEQSQVSASLLRYVFEGILASTKAYKMVFGYEMPYRAPYTQKDLLAAQKAYDKKEAKRIERLQDTVQVREAKKKVEAIDKKIEKEAEKLRGLLGDI